jgi:hypothetical protein
LYESPAEGVCASLAEFQLKVMLPSETVYDKPDGADGAVFIPASFRYILVI